MNPKSVYTGKNREWVLQTPVVYSQAGAVQNTWYNALPATGRYTRLINVSFICTVINETMEIEITCDGVVNTLSLPCTFGTVYLVRMNYDTANISAIQGATITNYNLDMIGHNISIRYRKTTAAGASALYVKAIWAVM